MFQAQVKTSPSVIVTVSGADVKELFARVGEAQEVFGERECGLCHSANVLYVVRTVGKFTYFECKCRDCGARLSYGQSKDMKSLFPKRQLLPGGKPADPGKDGGSYGEHNGWTKYRGDAEEGA